MPVIQPGDLGFISDKIRNFNLKSGAECVSLICALLPTNHRFSEVRLVLFSYNTGRESLSHHTILSTLTSVFLTGFCCFLYQTATQLSSQG